MNDFINFTRAGEIFVFANTPRYIIKHLRREQFVSDLSRKFRGKFLFDEIKRLSKINEIEFNDYLKAYVLIIAVSLQGEKNSKKYIEKFAGTDFRWAKEISEILISERIETTIVKERGYNIISLKNTANKFNTNFEYKYGVEPKIKISEV